MTAYTDSLEKPIYTIAKCLNEIIVNNDLNDALQKIVDWLANSLDIDCCYISEDGNKAANLAIFSSERMAENLGDSNNSILHINDFPEILDILHNNLCYKVSRNNRVSQKLHEWLRASNVRSLLLMPVFRGTRFWGCIGFGDAKNNRTWHSSEIQLQSLASAIGSAIESKRIKQEIQQSNEVINTTLSTLNEIIWEVDLVNETTKIAGSSIFIESLKRRSLSNNFIDWVLTSTHEDDKERVSQKFKQFFEEKDASVNEDVFRIYNEKTGEYFWMHSRYHLKRNIYGDPVFLTGTSVDISDTKEVEHEFSRQREQYQFLVQSLGQVVFTLNKNATLSFASPAWKEILGYKPEQSIGKAFIEYLHDEHVQLFWEEFGSLLAGRKTNIDLRMQLVNAANENVWVRILAKTTFDYNNTIDGVFGTIENINSSYNDSLFLQDSNERINTILNNSKEIILTLNLEKNIIASVNDAVGILGYKPEEWIDKSYKSWNDEQRQQFHELMRLAVQSELQVKNQQITFTNKTNTERIPFEFSTSIFYFKNSRYLLCVLRDVRERLKYEENISLISTQLTHLLNNIDDVYAIFNIKTGKYDFVSDNIENLYHCDKQLYFNNTRFWLERIHKEDLPGVEKEVEQIILNKSKGEIFYRIQTSTGERKMVLEKLVVGKDNNGDADKLYIVKSDYTNIENAEQSLMETERKFRFISENLSDFISIHDVDWNFTYASPSIKNILGYEPGEVLGMGGFDLVHPDDLLKTLNDCVQPIVLYKKETQFRYRMLSKDDTFKWVETYAKPVIDSKGEISSIISSTRDVTDQVTSENKLRESEEQYRLLSENSNDIIGIHNLQTEFLYISPSCKQILGYEPSELMGKRPQDIYSSSDASALSVTEPAKAIEEKKERKFLSNIITKSGEEKVLEVWLKPLFKADVLVGLQSASRDVTEREKLLSELENSLAKERELNELREKFVSTASHQFRTPLTVIQSGVEIMDMYLEDLPEAKQAKFQNQFKKIQEEVSRLENLMNDVLVLGRANAVRTPYNPEERSLVDFCTAIIDNKYNASYLPERQILLSITGVEVPVSFDEKLVSHAIENIISNAYKYSSEGNIYLDLIYEPNRVIINIKDTGVGIPEEDIKNLFQPFYRATNTSEIDGTGLGLSIVKEFIEIHGGEIFLNSKLNKGTTVSVILPIA
ncbi:PAS domain S-box protein [Segetibacter aerophilus]|uniref:histidine kinase n=1 Tax=Segetibacter aerophilus TaxID=670293 RepID=A0A512BBL1_9BACT|nr:PAS domain S-box protein [Segetibacter aerophilus]GEO09320.1 hypothetical protein SAE01_18160 [Segetibacter aerophilus]